MTFDLFRAVEPKVQATLQQVGVTVPVDLAAVGRARRIHTLELRNMLLDGALEPIEGGFKVYIYDSKQECEVPLTSSVAFDKRQRFTLAHEIAHTFFFDTMRRTPTPIKGAPPYPDLEPLCDWIASEILLPEVLLRQRLHRTRPLTMESVLDLSREFMASVVSVIKRVARSPELVAPNRTILLLEQRGRDDAHVLTHFFGTAMLPLLKRLDPDVKRLAEWNPAVASLRSGTAPLGWTEVLPGVSARHMAQPNSGKKYLLELAATRDV